MPNVWHQVHLSAGDIDVIGASIPGIPGVIIGHNRRCAWSVTAGLADTSDLFTGGDEGRTVRETIEVRTGEPVVEEIFIGENGPDIGPALGLGQRVCLKIVLPDADGLIGAIARIARAGTWTEFREALRTWVAPVLNFVYADVNDDIGYQLAGKIPVRSHGKGLLPSRDGESHWQGFIPFEELPSAHNPESGYLITANHRPAGDDYPHWLGIDFVDSHRAQRIGELIQNREKHSPLDVSRMQVDVLSTAARDICTALSGLTAQDESTESLLALLRGWDHRMAPDSPAAAVYAAFVRELARRLARRRLGEDYPYWMGRFVNPVAQGSSWDFNHAAKVAELLSARPSGWFDNWDEQILGALKDAEHVLTERLGANRGEWRYGDLHRLALNHSLGRDGLDAVLNRGPYSVGGDGQCVNANSFAPDGSFDATFIPGFRHVVDLSNMNDGHAMMPGGQSGDPFSTHYNDLTPFWLTGQMHRQYFARTDVVRHSESALRLLPSGSDPISDR
jgi:penicillin amidase